MVAWERRKKILSRHLWVVDVWWPNSFLYWSIINTENSLVSWLDSLSLVVFLVLLSGVALHLRHTLNLCLREQRFVSRDARALRRRCYFCSVEAHYVFLLRWVLSGVGLLLLHVVYSGDSSWLRLSSESDLVFDSSPLRCLSNCLDKLTLLSFLRFHLFSESFSWMLIWVVVLLSYYLFDLSIGCLSNRIILWWIDQWEATKILHLVIIKISLPLLRSLLDHVRSLCL